ncbi:MAG: NAD(P)-dependent oxidoreductase [Croceivirga sp.]
MKILLLGATGRTGKLVLQYALKKGHYVVCLARDSKRIQGTSNLTVLEGNPNNTIHLREAIKDCEAVISFLNISRISDFPWAPLKTPKRYMSDVVKKLTPICEEKKIKRLLVCSAWGVAETKKDIPFWFRWLINYSNIGIAYKDHQRQEKIIERSNLNWTIIRPSGLTNFSKPENVKESFNNTPKPSLTLSRKTLAKYLVNGITNNELIHKKVAISKA